MDNSWDAFSVGSYEEIVLQNSVTEFILKVAYVLKILHTYVNFTIVHLKTPYHSLCILFILVQPLYVWVSQLPHVSFFVFVYTIRVKLESLRSPSESSYSL